MSATLNSGSGRKGDVDYMRLALAQARLAELHGEVPVGAVVVVSSPTGAEVLGRGYNRPIRNNDPTAHAEIVALRAASRRCRNYRLTGATLFVTAEPCAMCAGALIHARISRLVYGCADPKAGAIRSLFRIADNVRLNHRIMISSGLLDEECATLLRQFFATRRKNNSHALPDS
jgi:tRNA(adenine34) deaminase